MRESEFFQPEHWDIMPAQRYPVKSFRVRYLSYLAYSPEWATAVTCTGHICPVILTAMTQRHHPSGPPRISLERWIKVQRMSLGYTQAKLARILETEEKNIRNWESGRNRPSLPLLLRLHVLFGEPLPYSLNDSATRVRLKASA